MARVKRSKSRITLGACADCQATPFPHYDLPAGNPPAPPERIPCRGWGSRGRLVTAGLVSLIVLLAVWLVFRPR